MRPFGPRVAAALGAAICVLLASFVLTGSASADVPSPDEIQRQSDIRSQFGLDTSPQTIIDANAQYGDISVIGIPLLPPEIADMAARNSIGLALSNIDNVLTTLIPADYGGSYIDQRAGGTVAILTKRPDQLPLNLISSLLPTGAVVQVRQVTNSLNNLKILQSTIDSDWQLMESAGIHVVSDGIFPEDNIVRVTLQAGSSDDAATAVYARYGATAVSVFIPPAEYGTTASRTASTGPLYGGMRIIQTATKTSTSGLACTSALTSIAVNNNYYGITAGHCGKGYYQQGGFTGTFLGSGYGYNGFYDYTTSDCDCAVFGPINGKQTHSVIVDNGGLFTYGKFALYSRSYYVGRPACISGATTNKVLCDTMHSVTITNHFTENGHTTTLQNQFEIYCPDRGGDSGAPYGNGPTWLGINSGGFASGSSNACGSKSNGVADASMVHYLESEVSIIPDLPAE